MSIGVIPGRYIFEKMKLMKNYQKNKSKCVSRKMTDEEKIKYEVKK